MWKAEEISDSSERQRICKEIIAELPNWFGLPDANAAYIEGTGSRDCFVTRDETRVVGMLSLGHPYPTNADIYWMGVLPNYHRKGVGLALFNAALLCAQKLGCETMTVETLSDSDSDEGYARTRAFYLAIGFKPLFELRPTGAVNPLMYMSRPI